MKWKTEKKKLSDLKPLENNPREISPENKQLLENDIKRLGNFRPLVVDTDDVILAGNQRYNALLKQYGKDHEVEVSLPDKKLTEKERKEVVILDNRHRGKDVVEILAEEYNDILEDLQFIQVEPVDVDEMWEGMPEFESNDERPFRSVIMHFETQEAVDKFAKLLGQTVTEKTRYLFYPKQIKDNVKDFIYTTEDNGENS